MTEKPRAVGPDITGSTPAERGHESSAERIVIRDKRRIDPTGKGKPADQAGSVDVPAGTAQAGPAADADAGASAGEQAATVVEDIEVEVGSAAGETVGVEAATVAAEAVAAGQAADPSETELAALRSELDERTRDLQRVSAEYANYRKRVDRDRGLAAEQTTGAVLAALLPVLDDLDRAREHGDLVGPFASVAEQLIGTLGKLGLTVFGEKGDPFDPTRHEAVAHLTSADVTESTCVEVMRRGYLLGDRLLRAALVAVADPE